jgi:uncharacterized protein affecting Mg2+/Co2+ transport
MFWYKVAIFNEGQEPVQVVARKWKINKCTGEKEEVDSPGIMGMQPIISPGDVFTYQSRCPLKLLPPPPPHKLELGSLSGAFTCCKGNNGQHQFVLNVSKIAFVLPDPKSKDKGIIKTDLFRDRPL